ncbi:EAL domain-containing protein [Schinkia azotoformans]|uniref:EAL domain-containing protein n=1 Tax=Schinkia azotoformans TaxID=1454 RepID=UPI0022771B7E|nr:EAL domain-containing protein [Schinkia azotoformans]MEC1697865.1 EAL domain-containing protein [Schinkia azotoformans]MEC1723144.1 EAL domain-containing protein [Schinkia azotoformans]MEC1780266.1 EAL domain-containing protein [Schinkia azotoformans]
MVAGFSIFKSSSFRLGISLALLFTVIIGSFYIISYSLSQEENVSHMINVAGRERMLTEKMSKKAIQYVFMEGLYTKKELQESMGTFEKNFYGLMNGSNELGLVKLEDKEIQAQFQKTMEIWNDVKEDYQLLLVENDKEQQKVIVSKINLKSIDQIESLDKLVNLIEQSGRKSLQGLNSQKLFLIFSNLLLIIILFVVWHLFRNIKNSERKYRLLVDHSPMGIMTVQEDKITFINKSGYQTLGADDSSEVVGRNVHDFINPEIKASIKKDELIEEKGKRIDENDIDLEMVLIPLNTVLNNNELIIFKDITEKIQSKTEAENIYKELINLKSALEVSSIVEVVDKKGRIVYVNDKFCNISKYSAEEVIGKTHRILNSGYHTADFYQNLWETINKGQVWEGQVKNKAKDGSYYWVQTIIVPFINSKGEPYQFITIRNDITARKEAEKEIKLLATHDHLTHLTNRRKFEYELQQAIRKHNSVAVLFIDLDRFKYVNDTLGHSIGDNLIKAVAKRLKGIVEKDAIVSRQGGDEFTILVNYRDRNSIEIIAKEMIDRIKQPYMIEQKEILITCSIGISIYPEHGNDIETIMKNADVAMYWSKDKGKDGFSFYEPHMKEKSVRIMQLELELRKAIDNNEFILYYQPKIDLKTNEISGCEALIRWNHPTMGMVSPAEFIPLAEETGLISQIGEWVLREACLQNRKWHEAGYTNFIMAVNMSAHQFKQPTMIGMIERILHETNHEAKHLEIEVTESVSMLSEEVIMSQLYALKRLGVSIAIDDFGTGYSSLKYLDMLPADVLKIDKSFIDEIGRMNHLSSSLMTNAIISLAKSLKMKVVAEGIENIDQIHYLKLHNCEYGQGYLISKPLPACELEMKFMRSNEKVFLAV